MKFLVSVTLLAVTAGLAVAQYSDSPAPPRLTIPGAVPIRPNNQQPPSYRTGPVLVRTRRPINKGRLQHSQTLPGIAPPSSSPTSPSSPVLAPAPRADLDARPVTEEIEEPTEVQRPFAFAPQLIGSSAVPPAAPIARAPKPKLLPQPKFFEPNPESSLGEDDSPILARFQPQERPTAVPVQVARFNGQQAAQKVAYRPTPPAYRPQQHQQQSDEEDQVQTRQREPARPTPRYSNQNDHRQRKPVAQILRKYREEHEDGTITWGFENDDGSFKEESIGIDCVTRGRYGYVDPDGEKREYSYETGIKCDPNKRDEEQAAEEELEQVLVPHVKHFKRPQFQNQ